MVVPLLAFRLRPACRLDLGPLTFIPRQSCEPFPHLGLEFDNESCSMQSTVYTIDSITQD